MTLSMLVLPAPFRPTRPTLSPARTVKVASSRVNRPPTSTLRPRTLSTGNHSGARSRQQRTRSFPRTCADRELQDRYDRSDLYIRVSVVSGRGGEGQLSWVS